MKCGMSGRSWRTSPGRHCTQPATRYSGTDCSTATDKRCSAILAVQHTYWVYARELIRARFLQCRQQLHQGHAHVGAGISHKRFLPVNGNTRGADDAPVLTRMGLFILPSGIG